jgi:hypothetical protein
MIYLMKRIFFSLIFIVMLSSCYHEVSNEVNVPDRLLSNDSIVIVLTEIQLAEGALTHKRFSHAVTTDEKDRYYAYIYRKFNLPPESLKENLDYYNSKPDQMIAIYDKVLENLSKLQAKLALEMKRVEKAKEDSLILIDTTVYVRKTIPEINKDSLDKIILW